MRKLLLVLSGYLIRYPLGGYAWQVAHYLLGLRALGCEVWFYEDTGYDDLAYNPRTDERHCSYKEGITAIATFLRQLEFGEQWVFVDRAHGVEYGPGAGRVTSLLRDADVVLNLGGVNRILPELRAGRPLAYIDTDPAYTQLRLALGNEGLRSLLCEHTHFFTFGENIGTSHSPLPTGGLITSPLIPGGIVTTYGLRAVNSLSRKT